MGCSFFSCLPDSTTLPHIVPIMPGAPAGGFYRDRRHKKTKDSIKRTKECCVTLWQVLKRLCVALWEVMRTLWRQRHAAYSEVRDLEWDSAAQQQAPLSPPPTWQPRTSTRSGSGRPTPTSHILPSQRGSAMSPASRGSSRGTAGEYSGPVGEGSSNRSSSSGEVGANGLTPLPIGRARFEDDL